MDILLIFQLIVLYFAIVIHEFSHGLMAYKLGDPTAKNAGRLTLNPIAHIDPFGTVILPLILIIFKSPFVIGYAKPVPFNPVYFRDKKKGIMLTALAGPLSNIGLALIFSFLVRLLTIFNIVSSQLVFLCSIVIFLNLLLAFFNLAPFYPLDGHHIFLSMLPVRFYKLKEILLRHSLIFIAIWIFFIFPYIASLIRKLTIVLAGI